MIDPGTGRSASAPWTWPRGVPDAPRVHDPAQGRGLRRPDQQEALARAEAEQPEFVHGFGYVAGYAEASGTIIASCPARRHAARRCFEATRVIRQREASAAPRIPIIAMTAMIVRARRPRRGRRVPRAAGDGILAPSKSPSRGAPCSTSSVAMMSPPASCPLCSTASAASRSTSGRSTASA